MLKILAARHIVLATFLAALAWPAPSRATAPVQYDYGTFALGFIGGGGVTNMADTLPAPYFTCFSGPGTCYYNGTSNTPGNWETTSVHFGPASTAAGAVSGAAGGATSSASLLTGVISVQASSTGNTAGAGAGYFTQLVFHGAVTGANVTVSHGGTVSTAGDHSAWAGLNLARGTPALIVNGIGGPTTISTCNPDLGSCPANSGPWTQSVTANDIQYDTPYTLYSYLHVFTSNNGSEPGSATMNDPITFDLPPGVTVSFSAPGFQSEVIAEPGSLLLLAGGLPLLGLIRRRRR